jgi:uncharacterized domain 1
MRDEKLAKEIAEILELNGQQPERLNAMLNLKLADCSREEGYVEFEFDVREWCLNPYGGVHGGMICALFDTSLGIGAVALTQKFVSTTDMSVSFLRPFNDSHYRFTGEYTQIGRRMVRATGKAISIKDGTVCATAMASYMLTESKARGLQD